MEDNQRSRRFMVLASARTGSNYLMSLLGAHPAVRMHGELFNLDKITRSAMHEALEDPVGYLRRRVYEGADGDTAATGFKMFYYHLTEHYFTKLIDPAEASEKIREKFAQFYAYIDARYEWPGLYRKFGQTWDFLAADRELRVVHLRRRNKLNTLVSHKTAFLTNEWMSLKSAGGTRTVLHLDPEECRGYFGKLDAFEREADVRFADHPKLEVFYEDLVENGEAELAKIFAFIGVPFQPVSTIMKKQIQSPVSAVVHNYGQLKASFASTPWGHFFE